MPAGGWSIFDDTCHGQKRVGMFGSFPVNANDSKKLEQISWNQALGH